MSYAVAELDRRLANLVRIGTIAAIDLAASPPVVRVDLGDVVTDWLPWLTTRAGGVRHWSPPDLNEQVMLLAPSGELAQAVVLPGVFCDAFPANGTAQLLDRTTYPDGSVVEYDAAAHKLTVSVGTGSVVVNCATATVNASTSVKLDTPETICTGNLTVQKKLTYQGGMAGSNSQGGATAVISGGLTLTGGDITADGIGLKSHRHTAQGSNAVTTAAQA
jgi:phage baseplate assembly protein V